jgi:hypothetical protein
MFKFAIILKKQASIAFLRLFQLHWHLFTLVKGNIYFTLLKIVFNLNTPKSLQIVVFNT